MRCAAYDEEKPADLTSYWGDDLCAPCAWVVAVIFDEHNAWPKVPWSEHEERVMSGG